MRYLIAGLGNMDPNYFGTRHNIGFEVADAIARRLKVDFAPQQFAHCATGKYRGRTVILIKPTTYMNLSGRALRYWKTKEDVLLENILTVMDDIHLSFGKQRLRPGGSDGGHNGLKSIAEELQTNRFARLRIGIGNNFAKGQQANYVLSKWSESEKKYLEEIVQLAVDTSLSFCFAGLENTMNRFNNQIVEITDNT